jgi:DNA-binding transcriptional LysR family regulator
MAIFARVVEQGSFRAAAKDLGLAPSRISETVADLESYIGVTLLYRTTRKIALTNEGQMFYTRVADMLQIADAGLNELNTLASEPMGSLKISLPAFMTSSDMSAALAQFVRKYPQVKLSISYSDLPLGLLGDGFDLNIRLGWLDDSSMMSRKLGEQQRVLVAGAKYAASRPVPTHPKDTESWDWIKYQQRANSIEFTSKNGELVSISGEHQLQVDNIDALFYFTCQNLGVTVLPWHLAQSGFRSGELVRLLPDWKLRPLGCYAVWADTSRRESLTLLLVRFLADPDRPILTGL